MSNRCGCRERARVDRQWKNSADPRAREHARELGDRDSVSPHGGGHAEVRYCGARRTGHSGAHGGEVEKSEALRWFGEPRLFCLVTSYGLSHQMRLMNVSGPWRAIAAST